MCELLGLSSNHETTINLSLTVLAERGENPNMHGDGWGIAFHEGDDVRLIKDAGEAKHSEWVEFIKEREIHSCDIIAHIRKSTIGKSSYSNSHPFIRELRGKVHSFAHNGTVRSIFTDPRFRPHRFHPVGDTDSEFAFCVLMDKMSELWSNYADIPPVEERLKVVKMFADDMRTLGPANFLYSDGDAFFAHGDERHDPVTNKLVWPGLYFIQLICENLEGVKVESQNEIITMFASVPLNESKWIPIEKGQVIAVCKGHIKV